jgi:chitin biosynthesis protein CHS5
MNKHFKFPPTSPSPPAVPDVPPSNAEEDDSGLTSVGVVAPSSVEVPPPPPVEKERLGQAVDDGEEDVGETEEIALN